MGSNSMVGMNALRPVARTYWTTVVGASAILTAVSLMALFKHPADAVLRLGVTIAVLAVIRYFGDRLAVPLLTFDETAEHSTGSVAAIAAVIILPWYGAVLAMPLAMAVTLVHRPPMLKAVFNTAKAAIACLAASMTFSALGGHAALTGAGASGIFRSLGVLALTSFVYYAACTFLVAAMISLITNQKIRHIVAVNHLNTMLQEATTIGLGLMLGGLWLYAPAFAPFVALPVIVAYFSIETFVRTQQETRESVLAMSESIDHRDPYTYDHSKRVAMLAVVLAQELGLTHQQIATIELSSLVHDIGKIGIPNEILMKPGPLTPEERAQMEMHPIIGWDILRHYKQFRKGLDIVRSHHEAWKGNGYPDQLKGDKIPLEARVVCIADAFEAMTADRPYRKAMPKQTAMARLEEAAGTQFDPNMVPAFRRACERIGELPQESEAGWADSRVPRLATT
jgi:putative nucleotidyltransferase with HDIG domain